MGLSREQIVGIHDLIDRDNPKTYRDAAAYLFELGGHKLDQVLDPEKAKLYLKVAFQGFLNSDQYIEAALLGWGKEQFNPEPKEVQRIFDALQNFSKNLILGGGSLGKSYSMIIFGLMDWARDPEYTNTKIISTTEGHAKANTWSTLLNFHRTCAIPLPGKPASEYITIRTNDKQAAMGIVAIPMGDDGKGRLQGFHPLPRPTPHPKFGKLTRVNAFLDEGEKIPIGLWDGIDNLLTVETPQGHVRITGATNPADVSSILAQRAEPEKGWQAIDEDKDFEWVSNSGYHTIRLDPKFSENVIQKKVVFPGLQTYEGYMNLVRQGKSSPSYHTFGRGMYPTENVEYNIIPPVFTKEAKRIYNFAEIPINVASLDPAFAEGGDDAVITSGRFGMVDGFLEGGNILPIRPRLALQIEQQFLLQKGLTPKMCDDLISILKTLHVRPEHFIMDMMQPISEPVLTPEGWKAIGNIKVGDQVIGSDGKPTEVIGVFPQEDTRVVKVTFSDGSWTRCGPEHLWTVSNSQKNFRGTLKTEIIQCMMKRRPAGAQREWKIPLLSGPVQYQTFNKPPIHPYLLGVLIGDGNLRKNGIRFSSVDTHILQTVSRLLPTEVLLKHTDRCNYSITSKKPNKMPNTLLNFIRQIGLSGKKSYEKYIPELYLRSSASDRLSLLNGLMDTDGYASPDNCAIFISTSSRLIKDVGQLVESLGGVSRKAKKRDGFESNFKGQKRPYHCRPSYKLTIQLPDSMNPFSLPRKRDKIQKRTKRKIGRYIDSITEDHNEPSVCIRVRAPDGLYVTRHHIITHNTGNGWGLHDLMKVQFGNDITGILWGSGATDKKIIQEDTAIAEDKYKDITTEMWFAFSKWLEIDCVKFMPMMDTWALFNQLTNRKFSPRGLLPKVESKDEYKHRTKQKSPDKADSAIMLVHLCRLRAEDRPTMLPKEKKERPKGDWDWFDQMKQPAYDGDRMNYVPLE